MNFRQKYKAYKNYVKRLQMVLDEHKKKKSTIVPFVVKTEISKEMIDSPDVNYPVIMLENRCAFERLLFDHIHEHLNDYVNIICDNDIITGSKQLLYEVYLKKFERPESVPEWAVGDIGSYTFPMHVEFGPIHPSLSDAEDPWKDDRRYTHSVVYHDYYQNRRDQNDLV